MLGDLFDSRDKIQIAIERLKEFVPSDGTPYWLAFSGGKDSIVLYDLVKRSGVPYEAHYNITTIDPPDLVKFIVQQYPEVIRDKPKMSFWLYGIKKGFPIRQKRWCCAVLKESKGDGRRVLTGCRWAESPRRAKQRKLIEHWGGKHPKQIVNPIVDWADSDIWEYIRGNNIPYCKLYDMGFKRLGCVACPMASYVIKRRELDMYPHIERQYRDMFNRIYIKKKSEGKTSVDRWKDGTEMFEWWLSGKNFKEDPNQMCLQFQ